MALEGFANGDNYPMFLGSVSCIGSEDMLSLCRADIPGTSCDVTAGVACIRSSSEVKGYIPITNLLPFACFMFRFRKVLS